MKVLPRKDDWRSFRFYAIGMACAGIFDSAVAYLMVRATGSDVWRWEGFLRTRPPVGQWAAVAGAAVAVPVLMMAFRALGNRIGGGDGLCASGAPGVPPEGGAETAEFRRWRRGQMAFLAPSSLLPTAAFFYVLLFGMMPVLWVVAAQYTVGVVLFLPRKERAARRVV